MINKQVVRVPLSFIQCALHGGFGNLHDETLKRVYQDVNKESYACSVQKGPRL